MTFTVYDSNMVPLGLIENMLSMLWVRRFRAPGEVSLQVPFTEEVNELLSVGNLLMKTGGHEAMEITFKSLQKDAHDMDTINIQGKSLMQWFDRRVIVAKIDTDSLTTQAVLKKIIRENITAPSNANRKIACFELYDRPAYDLEAIDYDSGDYPGVLEKVTDLLTTSQMGCMITTNPAVGKHTIDFVKPTDKTASSAHPCVFSVDFGSLGEQTYTHSTEQYKNMAYIEGSGDVSANVGDANTGFNRREVFITASDIEPASTSAADKNKAIKKLQRRAREELSSAHPVEQTFDGEVETYTNSLVYGVDYDLGDRVTCQYKRWGIRVDTTINEIQETYENGARKITVTFGEGTPVISKTIKALRR